MTVARRHGGLSPVNRHIRLIQHAAISASSPSPRKMGFQPIDGTMQGNSSEWTSQPCRGIMANRMTTGR